MGKKHLLTLCPHEAPECPKIFIDETAAPARQISVTDDFGNEILMSKDQFRVLIQQSKDGKLNI